MFSGINSINVNDEIICMSVEKVLYNWMNYTLFASTLMLVLAIKKFRKNN